MNPVRLDALADALEAAQGRAEAGHYSPKPAFLVLGLASIDADDLARALETGQPAQIVAEELAEDARRLARDSRRFDWPEGRRLAAEIEAALL